MTAPANSLLLTPCVRSHSVAKDSDKDEAELPAVEFESGPAWFEPSGFIMSLGVSVPEGRAPEAHTDRMAVPVKNDTPDDIFSWLAR